VEQAYWIPLYTAKDTFVINKRVRGGKLYPIDGLNWINFQDTWVTE